VKQTVFSKKSYTMPSNHTRMRGCILCKELAHQRYRMSGHCGVVDEVHTCLFTQSSVGIFYL